MTNIEFVIALAIGVATGNILGKLIEVFFLKDTGDDEDSKWKGGE